ncbi:hypothetical protein ACTOB_007244 [Actinoplanes oblitus]|uniref:Translation elongation factor EFTu/EF1A C-terminal domain-containing protein n=1 Tax=Actinoplanes oblitus TaxID=3040509 RepID=A0ABY8WBK0_9ACTN|nr:hypothetical protein [Actinoplanes oblitus]WIM95170.1 hypothetical protein ACTOB_007244 [Actinoplanes oblitus]
MIDRIEEPAAVVSVRWLSAAEGGRRSGPPSAPVYAATCAFLAGDGTSEVLSILMEQFGPEDGGERRARIGFLAPEIAAPYLTVGRRILIQEGARVVGHALIREVFSPRGEP